MSNKQRSLVFTWPMQNMTTALLLLIAMLLTCLSLNSHAASINGLVASNQLTVTVEIVQTEEQIIGQPLVIAIETATNRWFAKGTRIENFELADAIILANGEISINGTKNINGQTWSVQTRELTLYPMRRGEYLLPEIKVQVSVNTEHDGVVEGIISTAQQRFNVSLPEALVGIEHFIVAPSVELEISTDFTEGRSYTLGDAITREVTIITKNAPAMMIPPLTKPNLNGVNIYYKTPQVFDKSNRGELVGTRIESFTYIFEKSGEYKIPKQIIHWWNTHTNELEEVLIPSQLFSVGSSIAASNVSDESNFSMTSKQFIWIILLMILTISLIIILHFASMKYKTRFIRFYNKVSKFEQRSAKKAFLQAIAKKNYMGATEHLVKYCRLINVRHEQLQSEPVLRLNKLAFDKSSPLLSFNITEAKLLLKSLPNQTSMKNTQLNVTQIIKLNNQR